MNTRLATVGIAVLSLLLFFAPSCLGPRSKTLALFPAAELAWPAVSEDLHRGVEDGVADGDLVEGVAEKLLNEGDELAKALHAKDIEGVRAVPWTSLQPWVTRGIEDKLSDGEIGPGVAVSLREQLSNFTTTISTIQGML